MKRTKAWWARLTKEERRYVVAWEKYKNSCYPYADEPVAEFNCRWDVLFGGYLYNTATRPTVCQGGKCECGDGYELILAKANRTIPKESIPFFNSINFNSEDE